MQSTKKEKRLPVLDKIDDILSQHCKNCKHVNSNSISNEECLSCPWLKELRKCGTELGWNDHNRLNPYRKQERR